METKHNGPLSWEVKSATWPLGDTGDYDHSVWIQKGKLQLIANSEFDFTDDDDIQEIADTLNGSSSRVQALEEENKRLQEELQSWKDEHAQIVDDYGSVLKDKDEKIERLQERLSAADEAIEWLEMFRKDGGWGDDQTHKKIDFAIEKYNSLKK